MSPQSSQLYDGHGVADLRRLPLLITGGYALVILLIFVSMPLWAVVALGLAIVVVVAVVPVGQTRWTVRQLWTRTGLAAAEGAAFIAVAALVRVVLD